MARATTWERLEISCFSLLYNTFYLVHMGEVRPWQLFLLKSNFPSITSIFILRYAYVLNHASFPYSNCWHYAKKRNAHSVSLPHCCRSLFCYGIDAWPFKKQEPDNWRILFLFYLVNLLGWQIERFSLSTCDQLHMHKGTEINLLLKCVMISETYDSEAFYKTRHISNAKIWILGYNYFVFW